MSAHTPGPWEYFPASNYEGFAIAPKGTLPTLASVERCGVMCNAQVHNFPGQTEANARLIAAAPELLEALQYLIEGSEGDGKMYAHALDKARAAIAKSLGK